MQFSEQLTSCQQRLTYSLSCRKPKTATVNAANIISFYAKVICGFLELLFQGTKDVEGNKFKCMLFIIC